MNLIPNMRTHAETDAAQIENRIDLNLDFWLTW